MKKSLNLILVIILLLSFLYTTHSVYYKFATPGPGQAWNHTGADIGFGHASSESTVTVLPNGEITSYTVYCIGDEGICYIRSSEGIDINCSLQSGGQLKAGGHIQ